MTHTGGTTGAFCRNSVSMCKLWRVAGISGISRFLGAIPKTLVGFGIRAALQWRGEIGET
jgi:hypothetical protein